MKLQRGFSSGRRPSWLARHHPRRLLFAVGAALILAFVGAASTSIWTTRDQELAEAERSLAHQSLILAEQAARTMASVDLIVSGLAERFTMEGIETATDVRRYLGSQDVHELLVDKIRDVPYVDALSIIGSDGRVVNFSRTWPVPEVDVADRDYVVIQRDYPGLGVYISQPAQSRASNRRTIYLSRRLSAPDGSFAGVLAAAIETRYLEDFYGTVLPSAEGTISLFRSDGVLLARYPASDTYIGQSFGAQPLFMRALSGTDSAVVRTDASAFDNLARVMAAHRVRNVPLIINVTNTQSAILTGWKRQTTVILGATAAAILLIVLSGFIVARHFDLQARMALVQAEEEDAKRARVVAEAASKAKSSFLANMSHELRTPLNAILGFTEMLAGRYFGALNDKQAEYVHDIATSGHHLLDLINAILDMSKIEAGRYDLAEEAVDLGTIFEEAIKLLRLRAREAGVDLRVNIDADTPHLWVDRRALLQAVVNLAANAVNFTGRGGRVVLSAARAPDGTLAISVADTGTGIAAADLAHIFEPFQRSDGRLSRKSGGSGLGLSITKMLVERHGGSLVIDSAVGVGTTVVIRLPAYRLMPAAPVSIAPRMLSAAG